MRALLAALLLLGSLSVALPQAGYPVGPLPSATGQAVTGQIPGTATNDVATAGNIGEVIASPGGRGNATATFTNGSAVIADSRACAANTYTACIGVGQVIHFTTTGGLPTNFSTGTNYYVVSLVASTSYQVATTPTGSAIVAGSAGSGTQTAANSSIGCTTGNACTVAAVLLTAGDWRCQGTTEQATTGAATIAENFIGTTVNSITGKIFESDNVSTVSVATMDNIMQTGYTRISISGATTYYLNTLANFSGTLTSLGSLICTRER